MARPWLARFVDPFTLGENRGFRVVGAFDPTLDRRVTLVVAREAADRARASAALDRLHAAHATPPHPGIARATERGSDGESDWVCFDFPARLDLDMLVQAAAELGWRTHMAAAEGFTSALREAVLASSERIDPATGRPLCLGTFAFGNVLFGADGSHALIGFGHNIVSLDEHGRLLPRGRFFQAPEIVAGAEPTPMSDYIAVVRMTRTLIAFVTLPEPLARCFSGAVVPEDLELLQLLVRFEASVTQSMPANRPPIDEMLAMAARVRAILGTPADPLGFREEVARMLTVARPDLLGTPRAARVARDFAWLALDGAPVRLTPLQGRLIALLAATRLDRPGQVVAPEALLAAGWPGERMSHESSRNRLHVALSSMRKLGLADHLERDADGYRLSPSLRLELVDP